MTLVCDASAVVAALVDDGEPGRWASATLMADDLVGPQIVHAEVLSVLRRNSLTGSLSADVAALAVGDLFDLPLTLLPLEPFVERVWELRENVTSYDAWYVAIAESLQLRLVTLDARLARAPGPRCEFVTAPGVAEVRH